MPQTSTATTYLRIDAAGAKQGTAEYIAAMKAAQSAADRTVDKMAAIERAQATGGAVMVKHADSIARVRRGYEQLAASYDPAIRAQQRIEAAALKVDAAQRRGIITSAQAATMMQRVRAAHADAAPAADKAAAANDNLSRSMRLHAAVVGTVSTAYGRLSVIAGGALGALGIGGGGVLAGVGMGVAAVQNTIEQEQALAQLHATLESTRGAAGLTADELTRMASGLQTVTTFGDDAIVGAQSLLLTFTRIGRDTFPTALEAVLNVSTAMRTDLKSSAVQVGKALQDPVKGVTALGRAGIQFSAAQKSTIERLVETGRVADAQRIILKELETQFGNSARAARQTLGGAGQGLANAFSELFEASGPASDRLRKSLESVTATISDPAVASAVQNLSAGILDAMGTAIRWGKAITETFGPPIVSIVSLIDESFRLVGDQLRGWANNAIGVFVGAYEAVRVAWGQLPSVFADLATAAGNALITGMERAVNFITAGVDKLSGAIERIDPTGLLEIPRIGEVAFGRLSSASAGAAAQVSDDVKRVVAAAMETKYIENAVAPLKQALALPEAAQGEERIKSLGAAARTATDDLDDTGEAGGKAGKKIEDGAKRARQELDELRREAERTAQDIARVFGDALEDAFTRPGATLGDFMSQIGQGFSRMGFQGLEKNFLTPIANGTFDMSAFTSAITAGTSAGLKDYSNSLPTMAQGGMGPDMPAGMGGSSAMGAAGAAGAAGIAGFAGGYSSQSPLMGAMGGALAGAGAGAMVGSAVPAVGTAIGAAIGAVVGGIAGFVGGITGASNAAAKRLAEARKQWAQQEEAIHLWARQMRGHAIGTLDTWIAENKATLERARQLARAAGKMGEVRDLGDVYREGLRREKDAFKDAFRGMIDAFESGLGPNSPFVQAREAILGVSDALTGFVADAKTTGKNVEAAKQATREFALSALTGAEELSPVEVRMEEIRGAASALQTVLEDLGMSSTSAAKAIREGVADALDKLREDFTTGLQGRLNDANGRGYFNDAQALVDQRQSDLSDARALGLPRGIVDRLFAAEAQALVDGAELTGAAFRQLTRAFPELRGVVQEFTAEVDAAAIAGRRLSANDRLFAAITDTSTIRGALRAFDRAAQREREAEIKAGGQALLQLERAQQQERLNLVRSFADQQKQVLERAKKDLQDIGKQIKDWLADLRTGPQSPLSPGDQLAAAQTAYNTMLTAAQGGDNNALRGITGAAQTLLQAGQAMYASGPEYQALFTQVTAALDTLSNRAIKSDVDLLLDSLGRGMGLDDFKKYLAGSNLTAQQMKDLFDKLDVDASGQLSAMELQRAQLEELKKLPTGIATAFAAIDTSGNGRINFDEFRAALIGKMPTAEITAAFDALDFNNDNHLTMMELQKAQVRSLADIVSGTWSVHTALGADGEIKKAIAGGPAATALKLKKYFDDLDRTADGLLTLKELRQGLVGIADAKTLKSVFRELDANGDGTISKLELIRKTQDKNLPDIKTGTADVKNATGDVETATAEVETAQLSMMSHLSKVLSLISTKDLQPMRNYLDDIRQYTFRSALKDYADANDIRAKITAPIAPRAQNDFASYWPIPPLPGGNANRKSSGNTYGGGEASKFSMAPPANDTAPVVTELRMVREENRRLNTQVTRLNAQVARLVSAAEGSHDELIEINDQGKRTGRHIEKAAAQAPAQGRARRAGGRSRG